MRFTHYEDARQHAREKANREGLNIKIRRVIEFGHDGFNVGYACNMDSDYARAEIVRPGDPFA